VADAIPEFPSKASRSQEALKPKLGHLLNFPPHVPLCLSARHLTIDAPCPISCLGRYCSASAGWAAMSGVGIPIAVYVPHVPFEPVVGVWILVNDIPKVRQQLRGLVSLGKS
jgi:hypothetical protein